MKKLYLLLSSTLLLASAYSLASCNTASSESVNVNEITANHSDNPKKNKRKISFVDVTVETGTSKTAWQEVFSSQGFQIRNVIENDVEEWTLTGQYANADVHIRTLFFGEAETNNEVYMTLKTQGNMDYFIAEMMNYYTFLYGEPMGVDETDEYKESTWHIADQNKFVNILLKENLIEVKMQWQRD